MAALVETMFSVREMPWHGLGKIIQEAPTSDSALRLAGLDWNVIQEPVMTKHNEVIPGYKANIRDKDRRVLGVVTDRYKVVQNSDAFAFTDALLEHGVRYETAGSLQDGRKTWILARLPHQYIINSDEISPYIVFMNSHDGSCSIKAALTPVRVCCNNTLNLALKTAKRTWSCMHTGNIGDKMLEARETLFHASEYMAALGKSFDQLNQIKLTDQKVMEYINLLIPEPDNATTIQKKNISKLREDLKIRYFDAPDLAGVDKGGYRFVNAVSDFATHSKPIREHGNFKENLFARTIDGNPMIDKAYQMVMAA